MKAFRIGCALAALILPGVAQAQGTAGATAPAQPSPAALQLAKALAVPRLGFWLGRTTAPEMRDLIKRQLLTATLATRGPGCDPANRECAAAADAIAEKHAAEFAQAVNDAIDRGQALLYDATMSAAQIRATLNFVKTDAGQAFAASLRASPGKNPKLASRVMGGLEIPAAPFDEFYDATVNLPRAKIRLAPPPPGPPRALRRDQ